ncbi:MAG: hypothetical protein COW73_11790 [Nitrospirae bacterium CG18_big_fil_WC_8_21_14_2_50_70_55]|nr:hypothetical protein [Deltaproteobacteria bacterium]OIP66232.1 MAG: hypothetical protein AUK30_02845 [Nitrospirae bacterium CG2_30_70_394]PIQ03154.1 MAG: hypothetical protein COW73_11790 [Nitrospirae bacterium CG18_big_fil_WC_8_21_14_2_50_70_55]PIU78312.1 MAG: hypothetical protein COS73_07585 [Nitrospirae bacterium CG06_land_8_20_14_3_00_70_43]PIW82321.1 MAG: hypothetical protein COZ96_09235 [Nitrospirae bacterium CG_4_8_14_3_um_filter_70_85]PIX83755.1 MAG: hypothetical protein COZ33_03795 
MARTRDLKLSELPLDTRFKRKPRQPNRSGIRNKAKITIAYYDADNYGITIKRGVTIVKKAKMPIGKMSMAEAEKAVRAEITRGVHDTALIDGYQRLMADRKRSKGKGK